MYRITSIKRLSLLIKRKELNFALIRLQNTDTVPNDKLQSIDTSHFVDPSRQQQKGKANLYSFKVYIAKINCICFRQ